MKNWRDNKEGGIKERVKSIEEEGWRVVEQAEAPVQDSDEEYDT